MARRYKADQLDLSKVLGDILTEYSDEIVEAVQKAVPQVADDTVKNIEQNAPRNTGKYAQSWDVYTDRKGRFETTTTVYSHMPQLPHLLEHSHALRNGGRSKPQEHIAPAEQKAIEQLEKAIEEVIDNAGD